MDRDEYVGALTDLLSGDPSRIREANQALYRVAVAGQDRVEGQERARRAADIVLSEVADRVA